MLASATPRRRRAEVRDDLDQRVVVSVQLDHVFAAGERSHHLADQAAGLHGGQAIPNVGDDQGFAAGMDLQVSVLEQGDDEGVGETMEHAGHQGASRATGWREAERVKPGELREAEGAVEPMEVSDPPASLFLALALPAFFVMVFMLHRVFGGGWIDER